MSTILTGAIVIAATAGFIMFFIYVNKKNSIKRDKELMYAFDEARAGEGLSFSNHEVLRDKIIGLDGVHKKVMVFDFLNAYTITSIKLADVKECVLKKEYLDINFGNGKNSDMEKTLCRIAIKFSFKNNAESVSISFYDNTLYSIYEKRELEDKAKKWEKLLSNLMQKAAA